MSYVIPLATAIGPAMAGDSSQWNSVPRAWLELTEKNPLATGIAKLIGWKSGAAGNHHETLPEKRPQ